MIKEMSAWLQVAQMQGATKVETVVGLLSIAEKNEVSTMELVLALNEAKRKEYKEKEQAYWTALFFACGSLVDLIQTSERGGKVKTRIGQTLLNPNSIATVINFLKVWVKDPRKGGTCSHSTWLLNRTLEVFDLDQYLEGGSSYRWAQQYNHVDYILMLKEIKDSRSAKAP